MLDVSEIHRVLDTSINSVSLLLNGYLLYMIKNHSTFQTPIYQLLLAIDAGLDFALALMIFITQPVVFSHPRAGTARRSITTI